MTQLSESWGLTERHLVAKNVLVCLVSPLGLKKPESRSGNQEEGTMDALGGAAGLQFTENHKPSFAFISCHSLKGRLAVYIL